MDPLPAGDSSHTRPSRRPSCSEATARHRRPQRPHGTWAPLGSPAVRPPCGWKDAFLESIRGGSSSGTKATWAPGRAPTAARPSHVDVPPVGGVSCPRFLPLGWVGSPAPGSSLLASCLCSRGRDGRRLTFSGSVYVSTSAGSSAPQGRTPACSPLHPGTQRSVNTCVAITVPVGRRVRRAARRASLAGAPSPGPRLACGRQAVPTV